MEINRIELSVTVYIPIMKHAVELAQAYEKVPDIVDYLMPDIKGCLELQIQM